LAVKKENVREFLAATIRYILHRFGQCPDCRNLPCEEFRLWVCAEPVELKARMTAGGRARE